MPKIPESNLPAPSVPWARSVDNRISGLEKAVDRAHEGNTNSFKQINSSMRQIQEQVNSLTEIVQTLYSSGGTTATGQTDFNLATNTASPWYATPAVIAVRVGAGGRLTLIGSTIVEWVGYKSKVEIGYRISENASGTTIYNYGDRNMGRLITSSDLDQAGTIVVTDSIVGLNPGVYNITLGVRAQSGVSSVAVGAFTQRSIMGWAY